ncbi:MAG: ZIP family metal transporter, partial [Patescibacteria group bacterium]
DLIPEAVHLGREAGIATEGVTGIFFFVLFGMVLFFILEKFLFWYHCHDEGNCPVHTYTYLILWGDALHNLIDGVIIALAFFVDIRLGVVTTIAVVFHEIPQELMDFSILLHGGMARRKALVYNFLVAVPAVAGGMLAYIFADSIASVLPYAIALAAGNFIYLAAVDLMPELHERASQKHAFFQILFLILGAFIVIVPGFFFDH